MDPYFSSAVFLILSCWLWNAECRDYNLVLRVPNGGQWGEWGKMAMCSKGHASGFSLKFIVLWQQKIEESSATSSDTSLNGIRLYCTGVEVIQSATGMFGVWGDVEKCSEGNLMSFALQVEAPQGPSDDTAANNIKFTCQSKQVLKGSSNNWGTYGPWSDFCKVGAICGIQTKIEPWSTLPVSDNTGLNDVQFVCCD
ncbi:vitelline membrane outer layer protein 1-like [Crotalus tigris]|uniref:vitelline membrane outer layer protein 1-like n=1 Tax=Crotalus tigris TaxID=88082 RepID=UPI00192F3375|nr:vitelline membrane outer layer protein 1-like [Crotalus tigris]